MKKYCLVFLTCLIQLQSLKFSLFLPKVITLALTLSTSPTIPLTSISPTTTENALVQSAFRDYDQKNLEKSENEFTEAIKTWEALNRPRDEIVSLVKARANVRLDRKEFDEALADYDRSLELMKDGETDKGLGRYPEYADAFVGRGLANEGLAKWQDSLNDYNKAITLWGGQSTADRNPSEKIDFKTYEGVNPYALTFRGNVLTKLGQYDQALLDYDVASSLFNYLHDVPRYSDARANYALTLYSVGREKESVKVMKDVIRKNPGYADMHVALAADSWSNGNYVNALKEWQYTCETISVGCDSYKDLNWVRKIRRWPDVLTQKLGQFLTREVPERLKGDPNAVLAPSQS